MYAVNPNPEMKVEAALRPCCHCILYILLVVCAAASTGCSVFHRIAGEWVYDNTNRQLAKRIKQWSRQTLRETDQSSNCIHFKSGYHAGFERYVRTGIADAPVLPPDHYRSPTFANRQGFQNVAQWFDGYRTGVVIAQVGGFRDLITLPISAEYRCFDNALPCVETPISKSVPRDSNAELNTLVGSNASAETSEPCRLPVVADIPPTGSKIATHDSSTDVLWACYTSSDEPALPQSDGGETLDSLECAGE